ncbi:MAG TPA: hypothetical protein VIF60_11840 [Burkholderiaceae bacterium]
MHSTEWDSTKVIAHTKTDREELCGKLKIPDNIYDPIFALTTSLVSAQELGDTSACWVLYNELRTFCDQQSEAGIVHPFLWETLADFTRDDRIAIDLYKKALTCATSPAAGCYLASIYLALAERHQLVGESSLALDYALRADDEAKVIDDFNLRRQVSEFLLELGMHRRMDGPK